MSSCACFEESAVSLLCNSIVGYLLMSLEWDTTSGNWLVAPRFWDRTSIWRAFGIPMRWVCADQEWRLFLLLIRIPETGEFLPQSLTFSLGSVFWRCWSLSWDICLALSLKCKIVSQDYSWLYGGKSIMRGSDFLGGNGFGLVSLSRSILVSVMAFLECLHPSNLPFANLLHQVMRTSWSGDKGRELL